MPGGQVVGARLLGWTRRAAGRWVASVEVEGPVEVPGDAVVRLAGEDYSGVPRVRERVYAIVTDLNLRGDPLSAQVHDVECWEVPRASTDRKRVTRLESARQAAGMLMWKDTKPCTLCLGRSWAGEE